MYGDRFGVCICQPGGRGKMKIALFLSACVLLLLQGSQGDTAGELLRVSETHLFGSWFFELVDAAGLRYPTDTHSTHSCNTFKTISKATTLQRWYKENFAVMFFFFSQILPVWPVPPLPHPSFLLFFCVFARHACHPSLLLYHPCTVCALHLYHILHALFDPSIIYKFHDNGKLGGCWQLAYHWGLFDFFFFSGSKKYPRCLGRNQSWK